MIVRNAYLVDADSVFRCGLRHLLVREFAIDVLGHADNFSVACGEIASLKPDLVIVDPGQHFYKFQHYYRSFASEKFAPKFVVLCQRPSVEALSELRALELSGYALKPWNGAELGKLITAIRDGRVYHGPGFEELPTSLVPAAAGSKDCRAEKCSYHLSSRETQILIRTVNGMTAADIAMEFKISIKTAEWHRRNVFTKLAVNNIAQLTKYALRTGIIELD